MIRAAFSNGVLRTPGVPRACSRVPRCIFTSANCLRISPGTLLTISDIHTGSNDQPPAVSKSNLAIAPAGDEMHVQSQNILDSFATMKAPMSSSLDRYERISGRWIFSSFFQRVHCFFTLRGKGSSHDAPACQRIWRSIFTRTVDGAKHSPGSKMRKAVFNGFRFESSPMLCTISGGEKVSFSTPLTLPVDNERVQQVIPGTDGSFSSRTDFSTSGSLLIHLCRWKSPLANNPCNLLIP
ncbi:hypothetical protein T06_5586 [Trichinella sp. T6]|nr:hypothetical protein T06_5586 [Trichinella sp. T6]